MARIAVAALATGAAALRPTLPVTPARARGRVATKMVVDPSHAHDLMTAHVGHDWGSTFQMAAIQGRTCVDDTGWWWCSCGVLLFSSRCSRWHRVPRPRRVDGATCHAIDAMPHAGRGPAILSS